MVPALLVHCINEVEKRGLSEKGIYRISATDKDVKRLKVRREDRSIFLIKSVSEIICTYKNYVQNVPASQNSKYQYRTTSSRNN